MVYIYMVSWYIPIYIMVSYNFMVSWISNQQYDTMEKYTNAILCWLVNIPIMGYYNDPQ